MRLARSAARCSREGGQEWPVDEPDDATVGGVIAADVALPRQLRVGHAPRHRGRDGRSSPATAAMIRSGARTVKNVTGFDLHRLLTGSLGTLGVITQVALKVRPLPKVARTLVTREGGVELGRRLARDGAAAGRGAGRARRAWWSASRAGRNEVAEQAAARGGRHRHADDDAGFSAEPPFPDAPIVAEAAVAALSLARR